MPAEPGGDELQALMHQQFWLLGRDVKHPEGNLLLRRGFRRRRPPPARPGSTQYLLDSGKAEVCLWAFGLAYRDSPEHPRCFISRHGWARVVGRQSVPRLFDAQKVGRRLRLGPPATASEMAPALEWVADYERWVIAHAGTQWRRSALEQWHSPVGPADALCDLWDQVAASHRT